MIPVRALKLVALFAIMSPWVVSGRVLAQGSGPLTVEAAELTRHPEWVGRELIVDDRVALFQWHPETLYDQVFLKRAPEVAFDLAPKLRMAKSPQSPGVKLRGVLRKGGNHWWFEVSEMEFLPRDLERFNRALAVLPQSETTKRVAWANWAEKRARAFDDKELLAKALAVEAEAVRVEAEHPKGDKAAFWLALAEESRKRGIPEPEPSAIFHRALRQAEKDSKTAADYERWSLTIIGFLPKAIELPEQPTDLAQSLKPYANDPSGTYRGAGTNERVCLDRRLYEDFTEHAIRLRASENPGDFVIVANLAAEKLPNRPELEMSLLESGLKTASANVANLRQSEVDELARLYRDRLHQPERALALYRSWLDDQRKNRLSPRDSEGRVALAAQYDALLDDKTTSIALLREAYKLDPSSAEIEKAFLSKHFRKVEGEWVEASDSDASPATPGGEALVRATVAASAGSPRDGRGDSLRNATADQVRTRMSGNPDRRIRSRTQGQLIEQWIYLGTREDFYINFRRKAGDIQSRVVTFYSLPKLSAGGRPAP